MDNYRLIDAKLESIVQIAEEAEITSPAIFVVGDILKMRKPRLKNRKILSFRQEDLGQETLELFRGLGARPANYPLFTIKYLEFNLPQVRVYAFTSVNAVRSVFDKYKPDGEFVAVGARTKEELDRYGVKSQTPDMETVKGMETYLKKKYSKEDVVIFSSKKSSAREFTNIAVYDTSTIKHNDLDKTLKSADIIFLSSPHILGHLMQDYSDNLCNKTIMVIGPRTAAEAKRFNLHVDFMLEKPALGLLSKEDVI
ncbi:MAG: uroporphyrinogen-III synthase [Candidatus Altiarchaeota archaeon]|nr:uroporphyrinogen-III synthase [Candidatus Altiarchaeota archaeon]